MYFSAWNRSWSLWFCLFPPRCQTCKSTNNLHTNYSHVFFFKLPYIYFCRYLEEAFIVHWPFWRTHGDNKGFFRRCSHGSQEPVRMRLEKRPSTCHSNIQRNVFVKFTEEDDDNYGSTWLTLQCQLVGSRNKIIWSIKVQLQCKLIHLGSKSQSLPFRNKNKKKAIRFHLGFFVCFF